MPGRTSVRSGVSPSTSTSRSPTRAPRSAVAAATTRTSTRSTSLPSSWTTAGAPEVLTSTRTRCEPATTSSVRIGTIAGSSATGVTVTSSTGSWRVEVEPEPLLVGFAGERADPLGVDVAVDRCCRAGLDEHRSVVVRVALGGGGGDRLEAVVLSDDLAAGPGGEVVRPPIDPPRLGRRHHRGQRLVVVAERALAPLVAVGHHRRHPVPARLALEHGRDRAPDESAALDREHALRGPADGEHVVDRRRPQQRQLAGHLEHLDLRRAVDAAAESGHPLESGPRERDRGRSGVRRPGDAAQQVATEYDVGDPGAGELTDQRLGRAAGRDQLVEGGEVADRLPRDQRDLAAADHRRVAEDPQRLVERPAPLVLGEPRSGDDQRPAAVDAAGCVLGQVGPGLLPVRRDLVPARRPGVALEVGPAEDQHHQQRCEQEQVLRRTEPWRALDEQLRATSDGTAETDRDRQPDHRVDLVHVAEDLERAVEQVAHHVGRRRPGGTAVRDGQAPESERRRPASAGA